MTRKKPFKDLGDVKIDTDRPRRKGFPEVIFGMGKTQAQILKGIAVLMGEKSPVLVTRTTKSVHTAAKKKWPALKWNAKASLIHSPLPRKRSGKVAVLSAGTSDIPVAEEAALTAELAGCNVERIYDVGVSGLQRLLAYESELQSQDAIVCVAGMEGALPSVVGGLVPCPVIAVPTSVGYGTAFEGVTALLCAMTSCAPGVVAVNIDNGFGGGYAAAMIGLAARKKH